MSLPFLTNLSGDPQRDIRVLYDYLLNLQRSFANAAGEAIDPTLGQGGDGSLTIAAVPTNIVYTPNSTLSVDGVLFGHIDITFVLPERAIGVLVYYRETGVDNYKTSFAKASPWRLINLKVGVDYELYLAGQAANGDIGPASVVTAVTIPTTILGVTTPSSLQAVATYQQVVLTWVEPVGGVLLEYEVQVADDVTFTTSVELHSIDATYFIYDAGDIAITKHFRVRAVDRAGQVSVFTAGVNATTVNVPDDSIVTSKVLNSNITYAKIQDVTASRLLGRDNVGNGVTQELTVSNALVITGTVLQNNQSTGWSTSGLNVDKSLAAADTLAETQDVLGTLIDELITNGYLTA